MKYLIEPMRDIQTEDDDQHLADHQYFCPSPSVDLLPDPWPPPPGVSPG
jgi:hypothetical protein